MADRGPETNRGRERAVDPGARCAVQVQDHRPSLLSRPFDGNVDLVAKGVTIDRQRPIEESGVGNGPGRDTNESDDPDQKRN